MAVRMMKFAVRDLRRVEQLEPSWAAAADCCSLFLRCQTLLSRALEIRGGVAVSVVRSQQTDVQLLRLQDAMGDLLQRMEHQFVGVGCAELSRIHQLTLRVRALQCLSMIDHSTDVGRISSAFLGVLNRVNEYAAARFLLGCP